MRSNFDRDLAASLSQRYASRSNVTIHEADALEFDFATLGEKLRLVGNLPYNISTPLLFRLLDFKGCIERRSLHVAEGSGRPNVRKPRWKVIRSTDSHARMPYGVSAVVRCATGCVSTRHRRSYLRWSECGRYPGTNTENSTISRWKKLVRLAFSRRRKTLRNALQGMVAVENTGISRPRSGRPAGTGANRKLDRASQT